MLSHQKDSSQGMIFLTTTPYSTVKSHSSKPANKHFDEGKFKLIKIILNWKLKELINATAKVAWISPLPNKFEIFHTQVISNYYDQFLPLIEEEVKSCICEGYEQIKQNKISVMSFTLLSSPKPAKKPDNPSILELQGRLPSDLDTTQDLILLIQSGDDLLFGITSGNEQASQQQDKIRVKIINAQNSLHTMVQNSKVNLYILGSITPHIRMYDVCLAKPQVPFLEELLLAKSKNSSLANNINEMSNFAGLNESQAKAAIRFLNLSSGIQLWQGPPGTGKTTAIIALLKAAYLKKERILVCAPSNKAVQVLAKRFLTENPTLRIAVTGIEQKLDPMLQPVFIHTWLKNYLSQVNHLERTISTLMDSSNKRESFQQVFQNMSTEFSAIYEKLTQALPSCLQQNPLAQFIKNFREQLEIIEKCCEANKDRYSLSLGHQSIETLLNQNQIDILKTCITCLKSAFPYDTVELQLLNEAQVIFATLCVTGRDTMKGMNPVDILIVDEAAQTVEAETLIPFHYQPKKCLLVGDTKQLSAIVKSKTAKQANFDRSMMWRLIEDAKYPYEMLEIQYRMDPEIRHWPSKRYYDDRLKDGDNILKRDKLNLPTFLSPYVFITIEGKEELLNHSYKNEQEAESIVNTVCYLKQQNNIQVASQIGVITFYAAQVQLIQEKLKLQGMRNILVHTVDGFQGDERDIILISFVRSNSIQKIGFLDDFRRLNVALTRARSALMLFGHPETLKGTNDLEHLLKDAETRKKIIDTSTLNKLLTPPPANKNKTASSHTKNEFFKPGLCKFFKEGHCKKGNSCNFSHGEKEFKRKDFASSGREKNRKEKVNLSFNNNSRDMELSTSMEQKKHYKKA